MALAHSADAKAQSTGPVCNLILPVGIFNQIERIASVLYHVMLAIIDGAACVAYLVAIVANRIAGPPQTPLSRLLRWSQSAHVNSKVVIVSSPTEAFISASQKEYSHSLGIKQ